MNAASSATMLAKITWDDPVSGQTLELTLSEGAMISIGRLETNDICIKEQHVSRQHATIEYRDGLFVISDQGSANGVFVNDERLTGPYPLVAGDVIRLYVPVLRFSALVTEAPPASAGEGVPVKTTEDETGVRLVVVGGPHQGSSIALRAGSMTIGRASSKADWEICLQDPSISRPHARIDVIDGNWVLYDLGSANGTFVNGTPATEKGRVIHDGDMIALGATVALFRSS